MKVPLNVLPAVLGMMAVKKPRKLASRKREQVSPETLSALKERARLKRERKAIKQTRDYCRCRKNNPCLKNTGKNWMTRPLSSQDVAL